MGSAFQDDGNQYSRDLNRLSVSMWILPLLLSSRLPAINPCMSRVSNGLHAAHFIPKIFTWITHCSSEIPSANSSFFCATCSSLGAASQESPASTSGCRILQAHFMGGESQIVQTFRTTHWSVVLAAGHERSPNSAAALQKLCEDYWYPLYAYVRRHRYSVEDAQDLTQEFFHRLVFHSYLSSPGCYAENRTTLRGSVKLSGHRNGHQKS
jgi:hypothetical protein